MLDVMWTWTMAMMMILGAKPIEYGQHMMRKGIAGGSIKEIRRTIVVEHSLGSYARRNV